MTPGCSPSLYPCCKPGVQNCMEMRAKIRALPWARVKAQFKSDACELVQLPVAVMATSVSVSIEFSPQGIWV